MRIARYFTLIVAALVIGAAAFGQGFSVDVFVDENGNGLLTNSSGASITLPFALMDDPGPGGLSKVLTYALSNPPGLTAGDVLLQDGVGGPIYDVVRFNPDEVGPDGSTGCLVFYSDNVDGYDALGDTPGPPGSNYANTVTILEVGDEFNNGAVYTPTQGQPGFVTGASGPVTYHLISDTPEPGSLALLFGCGIAGLSFGIKRSRRS